MGKFKLERVKGEAGLTLVEVLAALVILSIVFIGFMLIFPQMTTFNKKTGTKLETMNIARKEIAEIQYGSFDSPLEEADIEAIIRAIEPNDELVVKSISDQTDKITISYTRSKQDFEVDFFKNPDLLKDGHSGNSFPYKVHLKVLVDGKESSESYGYIIITEG